MPVQHIAPNLRGAGFRVGIVRARFNGAIGEGLLAGALRALAEAGVAEDRITVASVPGALEAPLALQRMAQTGEYDALVALGAVIRGETYHFEIVANESAAGVSSVALEFGIPIGNGILTCETDAQAEARMDQKGYEAAQAAIEVGNLLQAIDDAD
jgi:6,7-dimethyl-8-ribityllumazine synthase